jgi:hypothetical protein
MADIVNLGDRAQREADVRYAARMDLTAKMIPVMIQTMDKFYAMGASPEHIVRSASHHRRDQQRQA